MSPRRTLACATSLVLLAALVAVATAGTLASNRRAAHRDARALLARLELPAGAQPSALHHRLTGLVASEAQALAGASWTIPEAPAKVLSYVEAHPPRGGKVSGTGSVSGPSGITSQTVTYSFRPVRGVTALRLLQVTVGRQSDGDAGVRAEADSIWFVPRPRSEHVPARTRELDVTVTDPDQSFHLSGQQMSEVVRRFDSLAVAQPFTTACPGYATAGTRLVALAFRTGPAGPVLARASYTAYTGRGTSAWGCDPIGFTIGARQQTPLVASRFIGWLGHLLGTSFAAPA